MMDVVDVVEVENSVLKKKKMKKILDVLILNDNFMVLFKLNVVELVVLDILSVEIKKGIKIMVVK